MHDEGQVLLKRKRFYQSFFNEYSSAASREAAYVYAITSAGVVHNVARQCAQGSLAGCGCAQMNAYGIARDVHGQLFRWGGCADNVRFAASFARRFLDDGENKQSSDEVKRRQALVNLHNNRAGRKVAEACHENCIAFQGDSRHNATEVQMSRCLGRLHNAHLLARRQRHESCRIVPTAQV